MDKEDIEILINRLLIGGMSLFVIIVMIIFYIKG